MHKGGNLVLNKIHPCSEFLGDPSFVCFEVNLFDCPCQEVIKENSFSQLKKVFSTVLCLLAQCFDGEENKSLMHLVWGRSRLQNVIIPGLGRWLTPVLKHGMR